MTATTFGRYTLHEPLGAGNVTESFRATATGIEGFEKSVVVKRILPALRSDLVLGQAFAKEVRASVALCHANIVQVLDVGAGESEASDHYLVAENVAGWPLSTLLAQSQHSGNTLPLEFVLYVAMEASKGLDYAHRVQMEGAILHSNISPSNLLISAEGEVKLGDFGVTRSLLRRNLSAGLATETGIKDLVWGISPEQLVGGPEAPSSDVFALVAAVFQCLISPHQVARGPFAVTVANSALPSLRELRPTVPGTLVQLIERALALDPALRVQSAAELHEELLHLSVKHGLRWSRASVVKWLSEMDQQSVSAASASVELPAVASESLPAWGQLPPETSILVLSSENGIAQSDRARLEAVLSRSASQVHWLSSQDACAVFQQPDGRDTEVAVRSALAVLRALGPDARSSSVAIDLSTFQPGEADVSGERFEAAAVARAAQPLREPSWHVPGRVTVTQPAARELRSLFRLKRATDRVFAIVGSRNAAQASGPFFGREEDLFLLDSLPEQFGPSSRKLAVVVGTAGLGKTRLLVELAQRLRKLHSAAKPCIVACPARGSLVPYSGVLALLARLCRIREGDFAHLPHLRASPAYGNPLDVQQVQQALAGPLEAGEAQEAALTELFVRVVRARATHAPQIMVLDGAHQLDPASRRILAACLDRLSALSVLMIMLTRDAGALAELTAGGVPVGTLSPLDGNAMERIIESRLRVSETPADLTEYYLERAAGNPFILEELLREGVSQGQIVLGRGRVKHFSSAFPLQAPRSLRIMERNGF